MKILNFGSCNIDLVYSLNHIVEPGETETVTGIDTFPGGKGLNQSIAAAKAGASVYHAGCVGCDGDLLVNTLKGSGVNVDFIKKSGEKSGHAIIQVSEKGDNSILVYPGSNELITREYADSVLKNFSVGDMLLLQNEISNVSYIANAAYQKGMRVMLNPSPINEKLKEIDFNKISYLILNEVEIRTISECSITEQALKLLKSRYPNLKIMLTLGENGCIFSDREQEVYQTSYCVNTVDTTAAGDTFTGYFAAGIARGADIEGILKTASAASAIAVSRKGAAPSIPESEEVISVLKTMRERKSNEKKSTLREMTDEYIEKNLKSARLEELAELLGYSSVYTGSLIKKATGMSFKKYIQIKRCQYAADKLKNTDLPIETIISDVGYENTNFFRKLFKEIYEKNPLEYRKGENKNDK